jgi:tRNA modification GTPase
VIFTDTAGIREAVGVEGLGVERTHRSVAEADQVWLVYESPVGWTPEDAALVAALGREPALLIANKSDLGGNEDLSVSALTAEGLDILRQKIAQVFDAGYEEPPLVNERHEPELKAAAERLMHAMESIETGQPTDLVCVDLYGALHALGRITGETAPDAVIERVFRDFCIGK